MSGLMTQSVTSSTDGAPRSALTVLRRTTGQQTGYAHPQYAASFAEFGTPIELPRCGGWLVKRPIGDSGYYDAMGCYPLFGCRDWSRLGDDLAALADELVTVTLIADPYGDYAPDDLQRCFDFARYFKDHYLIDAATALERTASEHHQRELARARKKLRIECVRDTLSGLDEWTSIYGELVARHKLHGLKAFSRRAFESMLRTPGMELHRICMGDACVGATLLLVDPPVAYHHLMGTTAEGYKRGASYLTIWGVVEHVRERFGERVPVVHLGAGAGQPGSGDDGLTQFKRGWTPLLRPAYLCGRVLHAPRYAELCAARGAGESSYFPAYRHGELL